MIAISMDTFDAKILQFLSDFLNQGFRYFSSYLFIDDIIVIIL